MSSPQRPYQPSYPSQPPYGYDYDYDANSSYYRPPPGPPPRFAHPPPAAPHEAPPPAYQRIINRVSLRPVLIFTTFISFVYLIFVAITSLRQISREAESSRLKVFNAIIGGLLLLASLVEVLGFAAAWTSRIDWARLYARGSTVALGLVVGAEIVALVEHYTAKGDLIDGCTVRDTGATSAGGSGYGWWGTWSSGDGTPLSATEARELCEDLWGRQSIWLIVWLVIVLVTGTFFILLAFSFLRQLQDPNLVRSNRRGNDAGAYSSAFNYDEDETSPFDSSGPYGNGNGYGPGARSGSHSYPPRPAHFPPRGTPGGGGGEGSLPSEGGAFSASSSDAPEYSTSPPNQAEPLPRKSMTSIDLDRKDSLRGQDGDGLGYEYEYTLGYGGGDGGGGGGGGGNAPSSRGRPESSRSVRRHEGEEGRRSDETLRGEEEQGATGAGGRAPGGAKV